MSITVSESSEPSNEFVLDMSAGEKIDDNKFNRLANNAHTCLVDHGNTLNELYKIKDEIVQYSLPPSFLLQVLLATSRTSRSFSDVSTLMKELIRLIQQYSVPWEEKGEILKRLRKDYMTKQKQLSIAVKHLEMVAIKEDRMEKEKRLNHWMRLYTRTMATKSIGRRWKFRIEPFKKKVAEGYNPYGSDSESDEEEQFTQHRQTPSDIDYDDELMELDRANEFSHALSSKLDIAASKRIQFAGLGDFDHSPSPVEITRPLVETCDATTWTDEPEYNHYVMVIMYRPQGLLPRKDLTCSMSLGDNLCTSTIYEPDSEDYQVFQFPLADENTQYLPLANKHITDENSIDLYNTPKISIAVYPNNIANEMAAHCSILLPKVAINGNPIIVIPPHSNIEHSQEETENDGSTDQNSMPPAGSQTVMKSWEPDWDSLVNQVMINDPEPMVYPLKVLVQQDNIEEEEEDSPIDPACIPLTCQVIKIQRHNHFNVAMNTESLETVVKEMGYKKITETESVAVSALMLDTSRTNTPDKIPSVIEMAPQIEADDKMTMGEVAQLTLKHAEELEQLQLQYNSKLQTLSRTLAKVKSDKQREIEQLEEALIQSEAKNQHRMRSPSELREMLSRKKKLKKLTKGLPEWGKTLPDNFYERLELFAHESMRRNAEMTEKIKREVQEVCEKQLATLHKLAPNIATNPDSAMDDVCIPALFMPLPPSSRPLIFNPRAHNYFHPPGSYDNRVSQPPAIFKLPPLQAGYMSTMNLYELSQQDANRTGPLWLRTDQSLNYTPAPPPSACDYYYIPPQNDRQKQ